MVGVYIHPGANVKTAISELASQITDVENRFPDTTVLVFGDFNKAKLSTKLPKYKQQVTCPTRDNKILDHCYSTIPGAYRSVARAPLGRSDHSMVYLVPSYRQRLKTVKPITRTVKRYTPESLSCLQGCFDCTDWSVFKESSQSLDEYADVVTSYISFCEDNIIPTKTVTHYGNDKPWHCKEIYEQCKLKNEAYKVDDAAYKKAKYNIDKEVRKAKKFYKDKVEKQFSEGNSSAVWKGVQTITDYKKKSVTDNDDPDLPNKTEYFLFSL